MASDAEKALKWINQLIDHSIKGLSRFFRYTCSARQPVGVYMSKYSLTKEQNVFGIRIESVGERGCIALGVAHDAYDMA